MGNKQATRNNSNIELENEIIEQKNTDSLYDIDLEDGMPSKALELRGTQSELVESSFQKNKEEAILESIPELVHAISQPITDEKKDNSKSKELEDFQY
eukprot:CAMPEP_0117757840 /NCGR_PEP_ID=MMETSP0947-20121206/14989_1 /TAXON_ID=44440 /ORGANISM="Chattonella subsalsa, Strain CCMP2191" /LENGTH=97 /DNA_ID=CAMNT_0005577847 /DNA_START=152 /DNA_END=446 /DNA_ORIENTATION=+